MFSGSLRIRTLIFFMGDVSGRYWNGGVEKYNSVIAGG
jgi:hypothetical protein